MLKQIVTTATLYLAFTVAGFNQVAIADDTQDMSASVFNFQQKLANSGNVQSQFKLGEMYEAGSGVAQNLDEAARWYNMAAKSGFEPAKNRLTFLEIKAQGYDSKKHGDWVASIKAEAESRDRHSMLLLAQMHREGLGVKKNLHSARQILNILSTTGNLSVDKEIALVDAELLEMQQRARKLAIQQQAAEAERLRKLEESRLASIRSAKQEAAAKPAPAPINAVTTEKAEELDRAEKRRRYEEVMRKLAEEQKLLEQQQSWAEDR